MSSPKFPAIAAPELIRELKGARRIAIVGGPRTGKTTLGKKLTSLMDRILIATDDYSSEPWSDIPGSVMRDCRGAIIDGSGYVLEGVQAARCLRKGLGVDVVIFLSKPHVARTKHQEAMNKGVEKIFNEWRSSPGPKPRIIYT